METTVYQPTHKIRIVTAAALFDGHDAAINVMRRILQASGAEVIHLGHNRSAEEIVDAAIQEDAQGIAVSSYQGGHVEFFKYMHDLLQQKGATQIRIYGGGGGVIVPEEIAELESYGIAKIFSPDDGRRLGLQGMINQILRECDFPTLPATLNGELKQLAPTAWQHLARAITLAETVASGGTDIPEAMRAALAALEDRAKATPAPVIGLTGTGGAGKSSVTDELVLRFARDFPELSICILSVDPTRKKTGGALLGDRIRMNAIEGDRIYMRSLATRESGSEISQALDEAVAVARSAGFGLIFCETSGIGQASSAITSLSDITLYVMTAEYGAPTQLEKIEMLDFADLVIVNKFDRRGSEDAFHAVAKQVQRNRQAFAEPLEAMPVFGTMASHFNDPGVNALYLALLSRLQEKTGKPWQSSLASNAPVAQMTEVATRIIPPRRERYLSEIAETVRSYKAQARAQAQVARQVQQLEAAAAILRQRDPQADIEPLRAAAHDFSAALTPANKSLIDQWAAKRAQYQGREFVYQVRDKEVRVEQVTESLSHLFIPKVILPDYSDHGLILQWQLLENVPGEFPYTAGVYPFKRTQEDPTRMFAGEGPPERTNARFHFLAKDMPAKRLSTAFDSVTLYGEDPDYRPDIYGKVGVSGVSIATLEDMEKLYDGFDLCAPNTSVSMTINGPAAIILAFFFNTAIHQQVRKQEAELGRTLTETEYAELRAWTLTQVRGTVQADILKEDQAQNTCIFSTEFSLKLMGDVQQFYIQNGVRNHYSVSISGYHIAEAGANPISQLAFTLANGFTYVEYYLSRGMHIDDFAPNLSFFFSNGLDPEYAVIGRVARRIWSIAMRDRYGAGARSQMLKYHIQTSGRSLHAQEMAFNDIRTTLQALMAIYDNCNSLHTNAYDEAVTTPTEDSVRRAMAIQLVINRELGLAKNENPLQGAFIIEELTELVEEAVLAEFDRLTERGGVLGAMELQYQRFRIQEESLYYEHLKHSGELPLVGVNTFIDPATLAPDYEPPKTELRRSSTEEKEQCIRNTRAFQERHKDAAPAALRRLQEVALSGGNLFAELMETVKVASLGQITHALYQVGGEYRRNM
ncbi:MAG: Fused isobutyryl-CoA mutase [bacterium]|nr:Fused isobutyryl-CoA mutase [bacterium]